MKIRELDTRKFKQQLRSMGYSPQRTHGSHEIWSNAEGKTFSFPVGSKTIKAGVVWQFQRENALKKINQKKGKK